MAKQISTNHTDTAIPGVTSLKLDRGLINFKSDWKRKVDEPTEAVATNMTTPMGRSENFRWGVTEVADVYRNSSIDRNVQSPSKRGLSILCQHTEVWSVSDSTDPGFGYDLPIEGHFVLKVAQDALITEDLILTFVGRLVSGLFETGSADTTRIKSLLRGALLPQDL